jgi:hypothetical protein
MPFAITPDIESRNERISPLVVSDRLLTLAKDAERSGLTREAGRLLRLALRVYDRD